MRRPAPSCGARNTSRKLSDISAVEEEIAREIVSALRVKLNTTRKKKRLVRRFHAPERGISALSQGTVPCGINATRDALERATEYFKQAIDRDPTYALAYAGLAGLLRRVGCVLLPAAPGNVFRSRERRRSKR